MEKFFGSYHTHTSRCGHAFGNDEEYVQHAINFGLKELGFSDHIFLPNIHQPGVRGNYDYLPDYLKSIKYLKNKYQDKLNILVGFEAEYFPEFISYYRSLLVSSKIDYLILGQHCYSENKLISFFGHLPPIEAMEKYTENLIKGMKTGLFAYVAHPDLFMWFYDRWDEKSISCAKRIIDCAKEMNLTLEINLCQARANKRHLVDSQSVYVYPYVPFWQMVKESGLNVVVGFDSHYPEHVDNPRLDIAEEIINASGVNVDFNFRIKKNYWCKNN